MEQNDPRIQHGIDNDPKHDTEKGAVLGGAGGAITGAVAGSMMGPVGAAIGAAAGAVVGAAASGAAVNAVDRVDNDNNVTGVGDDISYRDSDPDDSDDNRADILGYDAQGNPIYRASSEMSHARRDGIQTGGYAVDGTPDTRGISEKIADKVTGDCIDDKTGKPVL